MSPVLSRVKLSLCKWAAVNKLMHGKLNSFVTSLNIIVLCWHSCVTVEQCAAVNQN